MVTRPLSVVTTTLFFASIFYVFTVLAVVEIILRVDAMAAAMTVPKNIVVVGGGIQGTSVAYHIAKNIPPSQKAETTITLLEAKAPASAASGKGGGFMARSW